MRPGAVAGPVPSPALGYLVAALGCLLAAAVALPWLAPALSGHYVHPRLLALAHTVTLGWVTLAIVGAGVHLLPMLMGRPLWSQRLARWPLGLLLAGVAGVVGHFALAAWSGLLWAAGFVVAGLTMHGVNVVRTIGPWRRAGPAERLLLVAQAGLALTAGVGVVLAAARAMSFPRIDALAVLHAHFHLGLLGWILPMVLGIAARAYPFLGLGAPPARRVLGLQVAGVTLGTPAVAAGLLGVPGVGLAGLLAVAASVLTHLTWVMGAWRARAAPLDPALRLVLAGTALGGATAMLGVGLGLGLLGGPRAALAYGILALAGWASCTIAGMILRLVPVLVWLRLAAGAAGRGPVPGPAALAWPAAASAAAVLLPGGAVATAAAAAAGAPAALALAGLLFLAGALALAAAASRALAPLLSRRAPSPGA